MTSTNLEKPKTPPEPETPVQRSTRHKPSIGMPRYRHVTSSSNGKEKKKRSEDDLKLTGMPSIDDLARDLRSLVNRINLKEYVEKVLSLDKDMPDPQPLPIMTDTMNRFEKDRLTFGEQSPKIIETEIAAPRIEKSASLVGELVLEKQPSEEKDIPLLRAVSESAMNSIDPPLTTGGFSLTKPGFIKTPVKMFEKRSEETFGRKDSITRAFNQFHMKSSDKKQPRLSGDQDKDIELAAKNLERALEGHL